MLRLRLHMEFAPEAIDEAAAVLRSLTGPVRSEPGCRETRLVREADSGSTLTWIEEWRGEEDFEHHLTSAAFRRILAVMDLAAREPRVEIDKVSSRRGFELVEEVLGIRRKEREHGAVSREASVE